MKKILFLLSSIVFSLSLQAQLKSPDEYLGYELGSRFTPHYRIVGYFDQAAAALPGQVKLERYGLTNEGRELLIAIVASPENLARIDEIRKNNLRLTGLLNDKPGDVNAPVIVWLSYNVHGNEPSSSEVAMKTLYALLNPDNTQTKQWLKNTVVIIDPCMNPDGRDRYVNWYTQMAGRSPNANPDSREHSEPWPGGAPIIIISISTAIGPGKRSSKQSSGCANTTNGCRRSIVITTSNTRIIPIILPRPPNPFMK